jgi:hypothetical protein
MAFGWFADLADANTYFTDERLVTESWDNLTNAQKQKVLVQAYNRIYYSREFIVPTYLEATAADLVVLRKANGEFAYYLALHLDDEDRRKGLQAQATVEAGVVKEKYKDTALYDTPIPQFVRDLLCGYLAGVDTNFGAVDLERDEAESVNTKVNDF